MGHYALVQSPTVAQSIACICIEQVPRMQDKYEALHHYYYDEISNYKNLGTVSATT